MHNYKGNFMEHIDLTTKPAKSPKQMKFVIYQDKKKEWRWRLIASNGRQVADSGEGYKRVHFCQKAITKIIEACSAGSAGVKIVLPESK
jgi:uncharacterized protein YegP (UPF0339 family)